MTQVDLEKLVSACAGSVDRKITCQTLADSDKPLEEEDPSRDFPPESFWLSKDAEFDWFDRNAFLERKESTKGNSNFYANAFPSSNSSSQRFSSNLKSKAGMIGLPKTHKAAFVDPSNRRNSKHTNISLFPKRSESMTKSAVTEPSSPNVSCIGRVRSKKGRRRRSKDREKEKSNVASKPAEKSRASNKNQKNKKGKGIYMRIVGIFRSERKQKKEVAVGDVQQSEEKEIPCTTSGIVDKSSACSEPSAVISEPPGLGGMKRFTSGRRSTSSLDEDLSRDPTKRTP